MTLVCLENYELNFCELSFKDGQLCMAIIVATNKHIA